MSAEFINFEEHMLRPTTTERYLVRQHILGAWDASQATSHKSITVWDNGDGSWALETAGVVFEGPTAAEVMRQLANVLEET